MRFTLRLLALGLCMGALANFALAQDTQRLRYGTTNSIMNLPVWVAQDARLFAQHGLTNVEVIFIQSGTLITMGVVSGELNFSGAGAASVVAARLKGGDDEHQPQADRPPWMGSTPARDAHRHRSPAHPG